MSRTDKDRHWRLREEDDPELPWTRILNTHKQHWPYRHRRQVHAWWHNERYMVKLALRNGEDPAPSRTRHFLRR